MLDHARLLASSSHSTTPNAYTQLALDMHPPYSSSARSSNTCIRSAQCAWVRRASPRRHSTPFVEGGLRNKGNGFQVNHVGDVVMQCEEADLGPYGARRPCSNSRTSMTS